MTHSRYVSVVFILAGLLLLMGCSPPTVFHDSRALPPRGWHQDSALVFESAVNDTLGLHELYLVVRNTTDYGYSNLYLFLDIEFPGLQTLRDTIECTLAERSGQWTGSGFGRIKTNEFLFRDDVWFPEEGVYTFRIQHGMRQEILEGISDAGIRIQRK